MNYELEEQQRIAGELKQQLQSLEEERKTIAETISVVEAKLEVQELRGKMEIKKQVISQLKGKLKELEDRLKLQKPTTVEEQPQIASTQEETPSSRRFF
ncbi:MAG: hypothetical protein JSV51_03565 [Candidatus Bathyarchaeota archaeon]|nr:MAG: hypothetical protein JSV51_03565 [Candidatus Bathyarchaeota archaeon]